MPAKTPKPAKAKAKPAVKAAAQFDVVVVGGGPAGMMAAAQAASRGRKVLLLEKNHRLGEKLRITGGGRCNVTNAEPNVRKFLESYGDAAPFLHSAFARFSPADTFKFFEARGLPLEVEDRQRAFPCTRKALDVFHVLERAMFEAGVSVHPAAEVSGFEAADGKVTAAIVNGARVEAESFVLATGGLSHPETGSTGAGFRWLRELGHEVSDPTPSVVPIAVEEAWVKKLSGVAIDGAKITFFQDGKKKLSREGRILCAHFGLTGPTILNVAAEVGDLLHAGQVTATIDLFPHEDDGSVERRLIAHFDKLKNKNFLNAIKTFVPPAVGSAIFPMLEDASFDGKVHSVTKGARKLLVRAFKSLPVTVTGLLGYDRAVVADGGLALTEVDTRTMRSRRYPNLLVTGDLLDVRRPSGGFSLQLCWTTGFVAGEEA